MRITWSLPLPGPFRIGGTLWRSRSRKRHYYGRLPGWTCPHRHSRQDLAEKCADRQTERPEYHALLAAMSPRKLRSELRSFGLDDAACEEIRRRLDEMGKH